MNNGMWIIHILKTSEHTVQEYQVLLYSDSIDSADSSYFEYNSSINMYKVAVITLSKMVRQIGYYYSLTDKVNGL